MEEKNLKHIAEKVENESTKILTHYFNMDVNEYRELLETLRLINAKKEKHTLTSSFQNAYLG